MPFKELDKKRQYNREWARRRKEQTGSWPPPKIGWREYHHAWRVRNHEQYLHRIVRSRAKHKGIVFDLAVEDIKIPEYCPVLGIKLEPPNKTTRDSSASVDRIDNTKGYTKNNICIMSWKANRMKNNFTLTDLQKLVAWLQKQEEK